MNNQFKRILDLVRRTGDRMVVTDSEGEQAVVIMDFDEYEAMIEALGTAEFDYFAPPPGDLAGSRHEEAGGKAELSEVLPIDEPLIGAEDLEPEPPNFSKISDETQNIEEDGDDEQFYLEPVE